MNFKKTSVVMGLVCAAAASQASITWFSSLGGWNGAAGATTFTEDFSGFLADTEFRTGPVAINGGSLAQEGFNVLEFRNRVEALPTAYTDNNGTAHASMFTNYAQATVRMTFASAVSAFGFETWGAASGELAAVDVYNGTTLLGSFDLVDTYGAFAGFVLSGGDLATSIVWRSRISGGSGGEGFGMDNLVGVNAGANPVPEPFTMALLGGAALAGYRRMKARKQA